MHILSRPQVASRKPQAFPCDPRIKQGRKHIYSIKAASRKRQLLGPDHPRTQKLAEGRKPSGARTGSHKAARPHPSPTPYSGAKSPQIKL